MGKYDKIIDGLPALPPEDRSAQEKVNTIKAQITAVDQHTPESLVKAYEVARFGNVPLEMLGEEFEENMIKTLGKEGLKALLAKAQNRVTAYEQLMTESLDRDEPGWGMYGATPTMLRLPDGGNVNIQYEPVGKVENPDEFREWAIANGYEREFTMPWKRRESIVKDRALEAEPTPGIKLYSRPKIVFTKG